MDFSKINLNEHQELAKIIIQEACEKEFSCRRDFEKFRNAKVKKHKGKIFHNLYFIKAYNDLLKSGDISSNPGLLRFIQKRRIRTLSGVAPLTVLTKPYPCPGRCVYCPTDARMPKSYLPSQPAAQRAYRQDFNPYTQVFVRLKALQMTGHQVSKVELRVIGGTWSAYPKSYQTWFLKRCLQAMNEFSEQISNPQTDKMENITETVTKYSSYGKDVVSSVKLNSLKANMKWADVVHENETARVRCIGINVETRPDFVSEKEVKRMRSLGVTKVEMGVQTTSDYVQKFTKRNHSMNSVKYATQTLKNAGFKVGYHMMPNLPGASVESDRTMISDLFNSSDYQPDYLKIYPCVVVPKSQLFDIYQKGDYLPYSDDNLLDILYENLKSVPEWCRVDRVARDIPSNELEAGSKISNIRQVLEKKFEIDAERCREIRYREVKDEVLDDISYVAREYEASLGRELFLSFEDLKMDKIVALLRLRLPNSTYIEELDNAALVREIHVYGMQTAVGNVGNEQHKGLGKLLMEKAESISRDAGFQNLAVISGIGTREYYRKRGYKLKGSYMLKEL